MPKSTNQKMKLLYLMRIFLKETDENHGLTMKEILEELRRFDIIVDRKTIYADIEALRVFGMDIIGEKKGKAYYYRVGSRSFELAELKLLVDSVQSAKFITEKKSNHLIDKIENMASKYEAKLLQRQVYVAGRLKANNESIFYNVDEIHNAISLNRKISFQYFQWNVKKEKVFRHNGKIYCVSPWALSWDDENYYLIGYDNEVKEIRHYRVDKMMHISLVNQQRQGREHFQQFDMAVYAKKVFGMFGGEERMVRLQFEDRLARVVIDRFGTDLVFTKTDEEHFEVFVKVVVSRQFLGWIFALGEGVKILGPKPVVEQMREEIETLHKTYEMK